MPIVKGNSYKRSIRVSDSGQGHTCSASSIDNTPSLNRRTWFSGSNNNSIRFDYDRFNRNGYSFQNFADEINNDGQFRPQQTGIYCFSVKFQVYDANSSGKIQSFSVALREEASSPVDGAPAQGFQRNLYSFICPFIVNNADFGVEHVVGHCTFLHKCYARANYGIFSAGYHAAGTTTSNIRTFSYNGTFPSNVITIYWVSEA